MNIDDSLYIYSVAHEHSQKKCLKLFIITKVPWIEYEDET